MLRDMLAAMGDYFAAWSFMRRQRLMHFFVYPFLVSLLIQLVAMKFLYSGVDWSLQWLAGQLGFGFAEVDVSFWESLKDWLFTGARFMLTLVLKLYLFILLIRVNRYLTLAIIAPLLAIISEKTEQLLTGRDFPFSTTRFLGEVLRGIVITLRNGITEVVLVLLAFIAGLVFPPAAPFLGVLMFVVSAYFMGFGMMDYICERHGMGIATSVAYIRKQRHIAVGNGLAFILIFTIPFVGPVVAPVLGAVAACITLFRQNGGKPFELTHG
jgi:CysZ protein